MRIKAKHLFLLIPIALLMMMVCIDPSESQTVEYIPSSYDKANMRAGGLLYDNWLKVRGVTLTGTHPLYPVQANMKGSPTWRCKECHGWDYLGKDGSNGKGFFYTGIKGVFDARTKKPDDLFAILTNKGNGHDFTLHLSHADIWALVKFIREGLSDVRKVINHDGSINGDALQGEQLYLVNCDLCHGKRGNSIYFKEYMEGTHGIGWEANRSPDEFLHKVLYGHVIINSPNVWTYDKLTLKEAADILSYSQSLYPE
jgi:mono/diheme cytochrome c family protein